ncbi:hypothetical protein PPERSA_05778 [Pseudocohnilembus persalinus]|uniref:Uncharacterized protein n=1 Tax=Pseudocohnilembus persalinus TaxID=266149 RepID=A0A0V0QZI7_PSEPJ|nr:hypothetical protein PPERSA_05778 [Pseudocohnilembus persalinus]|eukprot:KRX07715.1 hypothetical protein PPERSA_05778 [Pseudocohnilembus persalinus]
MNKKELQQEQDTQLLSINNIFNQNFTQPTKEKTIQNNTNKNGNQNDICNNQNIENEFMKNLEYNQKNNPSIFSQYPNFGNQNSFFCNLLPIDQNKNGFSLPNNQNLEFNSAIFSKQGPIENNHNSNNNIQIGNQQLNNANLFQNFINYTYNPLNSAQQQLNQQTNFSLANNPSNIHSNINQPNDSNTQSTNQQQSQNQLNNKNQNYAQQQQQESNSIINVNSDQINANKSQNPYELNEEHVTNYQLDELGEIINEMPQIQNFSNFGVQIGSSHNLENQQQQNQQYQQQVNGNNNNQIKNITNISNINGGSSGNFGIFMNHNSDKQQQKFNDFNLINAFNNNQKINQQNQQILNENQQKNLHIPYDAQDIINLNNYDLKFSQLSQQLIANNNNTDTSQIQLKIQQQVNQQQKNQYIQNQIDGQEDKDKKNQKKLCNSKESQSLQQKSKKIKTKNNNKQQQQNNNTKNSKSNNPKRNTLKNLGNQIIAYLCSKNDKERLDKIMKISGIQDPDEIQKFKSYCLGKKNKILKINDMKNIWVEVHDNILLNKFHKAIRIASRFYLIQETVNKVLTSQKLKGKLTHLEIRRNLLEKIKKPEEFNTLE